MSPHSPLVAFNAHLLSGDASYRSAGISVYIANLIQHIGTELDGLRFQILLGDGMLPDGAAAPVLRSRLSTAHPWRRILWEQLALPAVLRRLGADLLHGPAFAGPLITACPQVITVHDLSFLRHPEFFRAANRVYLRAITGPSCRRAAAVIAVSEFTARETVALLGVQADRVTRVYHGVAPRFRPLPEEEVAAFRAHKGLPERFILFLGTLEPRKNLLQLIRAYSRLNDSTLHLVLAGAQGWYYEDIYAEVQRLGLESHVHFPGFVSVEEQPFWYNAAHVFAYVSTYEGFGMPVLEALACGVPAVTASTTALPEAGGAGALAVPPDDVAALADGLHQVATDGALRADLRQRGLAHAARFSWSRTAAETLRVYRRVLSVGSSL
ncbi:MAG: glycosyltransferase family 4 protein [Anaerolineae bacterium]|nr:glycosyltransferase family 4 protein [Anaerolineae bacterium]